MKTLLLSLSKKEQSYYTSFREKKQTCHGIVSSFSPSLHTKKNALKAPLWYFSLFSDMMGSRSASRHGTDA